MIEVALGTLVLSAALFAGMAAHAQATQTPAAPDPTTTASQSAAAQTPQKSTAQKFPFPGENTQAKPAPPDAATGNAAQSSADSTPGVGAAKSGNAAERFPFPGEGAGETPGLAGSGPATPPSDTRAKPAPPAEDESGFSSSSSTAPSDGGNAQPPLNDAGSSGDAEDAGSHGHRRYVPRPVHQMTPDEREADDLDVAGFYLSDGNFKGAYARAQDAVAIKPDDAFAQMALAQTARKMNKPDEAKTAYARVLTLDATPKQKTEARKALAEMGR